MHKGVWEVLGRLTRFLEFPVSPQCYLNIFDHMAVSIKKKKEQKMNISFSMFFTLHIFDHTAVSIRKKKEQKMNISFSMFFTLLIVGLYKICTNIFYTLKHTYPQ